MRKVTSNQLISGNLISNFNEKVKEFIASDRAFTFMISIKGTQAYWNKFLFDVLAMVKKLGAPTFFMTPSWFEMEWASFYNKWVKIFKNGPSKICRRHSVKTFNWYGLHKHGLVKLYQLHRHSRTPETIKMKLIDLNLESFLQKKQ